MEGDAAVPARPADRRAQLVLGVVVALVLLPLGDAVLLPHVDRAPARAWGPLVATAWLSLGWWIGSFLRWTRGRSVATGLTVGLAGCLVAARLPAFHDGLVDGILAGQLPYHALVVGWLSLAAAPVALPLGLLLTPGLGDGDRRGLLLLLVGAAVGAGLAPWMGEVLLGRADTLRAAAVVAAATGPVLGTGSFGMPRLARGSATGLVAGGVTAVVSLRLLVPITDLGSNTVPWWIGLACVGAAAGCLLYRHPPTRPLDALLLCALPQALSSEPVVRPLRPAAFAPGVAWPSWVPGADAIAQHVHLIVDLVRLGCVALPFGFLVGRLIATRDDPGRPLASMPVLLTLAVPATLLVLLPNLGVVGTLAAVAVPVVVVAFLVPPRPSRTRLTVTAVLAVGLSFAHVPDGPGGLQAEQTWQLADGLAARYFDPVDEQREVALDGRAPVGRHPLQERRFVHLPFLWGVRGRTLLVASDMGTSEQAALAHAPPFLHWLRPFPVPSVDDLQTPGRQRACGNERMLLRQEQDAAPYHLVMFMPDPRVRRRAPLLCTVDFYAEALELLTPDGLFCQWWDLATIDVSDLKAIIASAAYVFPETYLVIDHPRSRRGLVGIVGRRLPLKLSLDRIDEALDARPEVRRELTRVGLDALGIACLVSQNEGQLEMLTSVEERVDDGRSVLGAQGGRRELAQPHALFTALDTFGRRRCDARAWIQAEAHERHDLAAHTRDVLAGWQHLLGAAQLAVRTQGATAPAFESETPGGCSDDEGLAMLLALVSLPDWRYLQDQVVAYARRIEQVGRGEEAEQYLRRAISLDESSPRLRYELASLVERQGDTDDARVLFNTVLAFDPQHAEARAALARLGDG